MSDLLAIQFDLLRVGHCHHPECIAMRGGRFRSIEFPALVGLMRHPVHGFMLYDTGYSRHFFQATRRFPECLYRMVTPPALPPEEELLHQLSERGIKAGDIATIFISHFHADHVAGLRDFPQARFVATRDELHDLKRMSRFRRLTQAHLSALIPEDLEPRLNYAEDCSSLHCQLDGFPESRDLLGDGSLHGISLPGHTRSQLGLYFTDTTGRRVFLIGDAAWKIEALQSRRLPSRITRLLFADSRRYAETFQQLADLHLADPGLALIPSHCATSWQVQGGSRHVHA